MKTRLAQDMLGVFGSRIGVAMLGTVTGILLARGLGPHDRGILALVLLLPSTLMTITKLGITQANVYCVRRDGAPIERVTSNSLLLALLLGTGCGVITWLLRDVLLSTVLRGVPVWALLLALWRLPLLLIDNFFCGVLQALGNFSLYNRRTLAGAGLVLSLIGAAYLSHRLDLWSAAIIYAVVTTLVVASLLIATRSVVKFGLRPDRALLASQMRFGLKSYVQILTMHLLFRSGVYMVAYFLTPAQTAFYSLALHFTEMILEIPQAVGWVIYPHMASLEKSKVHRLTAQACRRTILLTATGGLGAALLGPFLIPLWYGGAFAAASRPLALATLGMVMMSVFTILSRDFTSRNEQWVNTRAGIVGLISNVVLNIVLIPYMGISGAALATSLAYTLAALMLLVPFRRAAGVSWREVVLPTADDARAIWQALTQTVGGRLTAGRGKKATPAITNTAERRLELELCTEPQRWDSLVGALPGATVFHRSAWLQFVAQRRAAQLRMFSLMRDGECVGVFPVFVTRRGMFRIAASPPAQAATPYLGPLIAPERIGAAIEAATARLRAERVSYLEIRFPVHVAAEALSAKGFQTETRATFVLDLRPGEEELWKGSLNSTCRRAVRKATSSGVSIVEGDLAHNLDRYYEMATQVFAKSHRLPPLSREDYEALAEMSRQGGPIKVFFAYHQERLIAGGIFPYDERTIYYLDGASDGAGQEVRPNNLLHWEVIRWACARGLTTYDMVGAGIESVARFKRGFGPVEAPYTYAFRSLNAFTGAARSTYALLAPAGRRAQHAVHRLTARTPAKLPVEAVGND